MPKYKLLYIDDKPENLQIFKEALGKFYRISICDNSLDALSAMRKCSPDLIILDVHMPALDGVGVFKKVKKENDLFEIPIMFYSMDNSDETVSKLLKLGPEDYLHRSMSHAQIRARIDNRLKKFVNIEKQKLSLIVLENLILDTSSFEARINQKVVPLTSIEYRMLYFILENQERNTTKKELVKFVWNEVYVVSKTVNTHMSNLRNKIKHANFQIKINRNNQIRIIRSDTLDVLI